MSIRSLLNLNRNIWYVLLASAAMGFSLAGGIYAVLFNIYLLRLDYGTEFIGILGSIDTFVYMLMAIPAGLLGQRWGARQAMLLGTTLLTAAGLLIPTAQIFNGGGQTAVFITIAVFRSVGTALFLVTSTPYIMAYSKGDARNTAFALDSAAYGIAAFLGGLLGGILPGWTANWLKISLDNPNAYRYPFWVAGLVMSVGIWLLWRSEDERGVETAVVPSSSSLPTLYMLRTLPRSLRNTIIKYTLIAILGGIGISIPWTFGTVYLDDIWQVPTTLIGTFSAMASLFGVIIVLLLPRLIGRWSLAAVTVFSFLLPGLAIILIGIAPAWQLAGLGFIGVFGFNNARFTAYRIYSMAPIPDAYQSIVSGLFNMGTGLGYGVMSLLAGFLIAEVGYTQLFVGGGLVLVATAVFIYLLPVYNSPQSVELPLPKV